MNPRIHLEFPFLNTAKDMEVESNKRNIQFQTDNGSFHKSKINMDSKS